MLWLVHGLIVLLYGAGAAALALGLPRALPETDPSLAYGAGAIGFFLAALVHQTVARAFGRRSVRRALAALDEAQHQTADKLAAIESDIARLAEVLEKGGVSENSAELVSEMRVMRGLLAQLSARTGSRAPKPASRPRRAPTAIVDETEPVPVIVPQTLNDDEVLAITQQALHDNRIDLYVQPVVTLPGRDVRFYETFSRIRHEDGSVILPDQYLQLATKMGLIGTIDNMLLFRCVQLIRRVRRDNPGIGFFCNVSPHNLADAEFFQQFMDFLEHNTELAGTLIFEFSHDGVDSTDFNGNLGHMAEAGFTFSVDQVKSLDVDFVSLAKRNFRFVKIDANMLISQEAQASAPVAIADLKAAMKKSGVDLIAEKVETEQIVIDLLDYNIDFGQGYLFGEPQPSQMTSA